MQKVSATLSQFKNRLSRSGFYCQTIYKPGFVLRHKAKALIIYLAFSLPKRSSGSCELPSAGTC